MAETEKGEVAAADVTAVFVDDGGDVAGVAEAARKAALAGTYGDVFLRVVALPAPLVGLVRVELYDALGRPCVDPAFVAAVSSAGERKAVFVHYNRTAGQALVHGFSSGRELEGWMGAPHQADDKVRELIGWPLLDLARDDGTFRGVGLAPSGTVALVRGRTLAVPAGMPTGLGSFGFHGRGGSQGSDNDSGDDSDDDSSDGGDRGQVVLLAWDEAQVEHAWSDTSGAALAERVRALPERLVGPLGPVREETAAQLAALGDTSPTAAGFSSVRARELVTLAEALVFSGGEEVAFVDERLLPLFTLGTGDPVLDDPDEAGDLEALPSVLAAMVDVLPYKAPGGAVLEMLDDAWLSPLAPWARAGEEYVGSIFRLARDPLRALLTATDEHDLAARIDRFYRSWWRAETDEPLTEKFIAWRRALDEKGAADVQRLLRAWTEWRVVTTLATHNGLTTGLIFSE